MARITRLELDPIRVDVANAIVDVHVDVSYSRSDKDANTPYRMVCRLLGHDAVPEGLEDDVDDAIPGTLTPDGGQIIRADGLNLQTVDLNATVSLDKLDEDFLTLSNPDEIKAHVELTPILPKATEAESNVRRLTIN